MAKGISLHIGLNYVDPNHYNGWDGELAACEFDARDMALIAASKGFQTHSLIREQATRDQVIEAIKSTVSELEADDILHVSYSGHGGQVPDLNGDEPDGADETWCLYDGQLIDDELKHLWRLFKSGVRIFVTSDSCHSGSIVRTRISHLNMDPGVPRFMDRDLAASVYLQNRDFYDGLSNRDVVKSSDIKATVLLLSGCQDNQYSYDGTFNGQFTGALEHTWNGGRFTGNYHQFHKQIKMKLPDYQTPNMLIIGNLSHDFSDQIPFTIDPE
jgi:hypothetical protein